MKNKLMPLIDKILLRKRSLIETVNDQLKNISQVEHTTPQRVEFHGKYPWCFGRLCFTA